MQARLENLQYIPISRSVIPAQRTRYNFVLGRSYGSDQSHWAVLGGSAGPPSQSACVRQQDDFCSDQTTSRPCKADGIRSAGATISDTAPESADGTDHVTRLGQHSSALPTPSAQLSDNSPSSSLGRCSIFGTLDSNVQLPSQSPRTHAYIGSFCRFLASTTGT